MYVLERTQILPRPLTEVFAFFADAANLERMTPPFLGFQIKTPLPITMGAGTLIDYKISLHGIPMKWRTRIGEYVPEVRFVDEQLKGPYKVWHHTHEFRAVPGGTEVVDRVQYELPLGPLGKIAHALFVRRQLATIFDYRERTMSELFGPVPARVAT